MDMNINNRYYVGIHQNPESMKRIYSAKAIISSSSIHLENRTIHTNELIAIPQQQKPTSDKDIPSNQQIINDHAVVQIVLYSEIRTL
jgi:hypothetical protein